MTKVKYQNNLVTTVLRETYPVVYTDEKPSEEVKSEYERLEKIEESYENIEAVRSDNRKRRFKRIG